MDFRAYIREQISTIQHGLEFGPSYNPILPKSHGYNVLTVDYISKEDLYSKYQYDSAVDINRIEDVDIIDRGQELLEASIGRRGFDYIVSSHNIEHLPDPIKFLQRAERALKPGGKLYLMIPDRRRCFDFYRPISTCGQMLAAYQQHRQIHSPETHYDSIANAATKNGAIAWADDSGTPDTLIETLRAAYDTAVRETQEYLDAHAWVFTPSSFRLILHDLQQLNIVKLNEIFFHTSIGCEFFIVLSRSGAPTKSDRLDLVRKTLQESGCSSIEPNPVSENSLDYAFKIPVTDMYVSNIPSAQNALDLFQGLWKGAFPGEHGLHAGSMPLHNDARIHWLIQSMNGVAELDILELGPLEASHTAMLLNAGARSVLAVEANKTAYLRCLVVKEVLKLHGASFLLGNFLPFLEQGNRIWPLIVASGVLYHMQDPLYFLELLASRTENLFLWTHFIDDGNMPPNDPRRNFLTSREQIDWKGEHIILYTRPYDENRFPDFCGGLDNPKWLEKGSLFTALRVLGFTHIETAFEDSANQFGPNICILAQKK